MRKLHDSSRETDNMLPDDGRSELRPLAASLHEKRADFALMTMCDATAGGDAEYIIAVRLAHLACHVVVVVAIVVMMVVVVVASVIRMAMVVVGVEMGVVMVRRPMNRAANDFQAVMVAVLRRKPVQAVPQQRDAAVSGDEHSRQKFAGDGIHGISVFNLVSAG